MVSRESILGAVLELGSSVSPLWNWGRQTQRMVNGYAVGITSRSPRGFHCL